MITSAVLIIIEHNVTFFVCTIIRSPTAGKTIIFSLCSLTFLLTTTAWITFTIGCNNHSWFNNIEKKPINFDFGFGYTLALISSFFSLISSIVTFPVKCRLQKIKNLFTDYRTINSAAVIHHMEQENCHTELEVTFIRYKWEGVNRGLKQIIFDSKEYFTPNKVSNESEKNEIYKEFLEESVNNKSSIIYSIQLCSDFREKLNRRQFKELAVSHLKECKCSDLLQRICTNSVCQWRTFEIQIDYQILSSDDKDECDGWNVTDLTLMNKLGFNFLSPISQPTNINLSLIGYLQKQKDFRSRFQIMSRYIVESLLIWNDGLNLIRELLQELNDSIHKKLIIKILKNEIFQTWPPPLWYTSLCKCRHFIEQDYLLPISTFTTENIRRFISNPTNQDYAIFSLFTLLDLKYQDFWLNDRLKYGIFDKLQIDQFIPSIDSNKKYYFVSKIYSKTVEIEHDYEMSNSCVQIV